MQARALAGEIFSARRIQRAAVWVEDSFDARGAALSFAQASPPDAARTFYAGKPGDRDDLILRTARGEYGCVVMLSQPKKAAELARRLRAGGYRGLLAGPLWLASPEYLQDGPATEGTLLAAPARGATLADTVFNTMFSAAYGTPPTPAALYGHDAAGVLIVALRGMGRTPGVALSRILEGTSMSGLTGLVRFDERRGRDDSASLSTVEAGRLIPLHRESAAVR